MVFLIAKDFMNTDTIILSSLAFKYNIVPYKAVSHVDEPRAHIRALKGKKTVYGYTFSEILNLIRKEHSLPGYKKADYSRIFINTRIRNCGMFFFILKVIKKIIFIIYTDLWGFCNDNKYLNGDKKSYANIKNRSGQ